VDTTLAFLPNTFALVCDDKGYINKYSKWFESNHITITQGTNIATIINNFDEELFLKLITTNLKYCVELIINKETKVLELIADTTNGVNFLIIGNDVTLLRETQSELDFISKISELNVNRLHKTLLQLENSKIKLIETQTSKEQMMAHMSHEVRSPLNVINGFAQLLKETNLSNEQAEYLEAIVFASDNLLNLANSILDFSKLEAGKYTIHKTNTNVSKLIQLNLTAFAIKASGKNIQLKYNNTLNPDANYLIDANHYSQIIINLLSNAIKFTSAGEIEITTEYKNNILLTTIKDSGIGISAEHLPTIFDTYTQVPNADYNKLGTGLGLTIVRQLVTLNNGTITVSSTPNIGTLFTVKLPTTKTVALQTNSNKDTKPNSLNTPKALSVLVVEDQVLNQKLITKLLTNNGYTVTIASNGQEAIDSIISTTNFDVILMDLNMPVMDGITATTIIRNQLNCNTPILCLTADSSIATLSKVVIAGGNLTITKPFNIEKLILMLEHNLNYNASLNYFMSIAGSDAAFKQELIANCIQTIETERLAFIQAYENTNNTNIIAAIHKLKGASSMFYCSHFDSLMATINTKSTSKSITQLDFIEFTGALNSFIGHVKRLA
jgi:two-component system, chemotaxis family, CheB/CheR fusion protein